MYSMLSPEATTTPAASNSPGELPPRRQRLEVVEQARQEDQHHADDHSENTGTGASATDEGALPPEVSLPHRLRENRRHDPGEDRDAPDAHDRPGVYVAIARVVHVAARQREPPHERRHKQA